jgi:hypothetical protein
VTELVQLVIAGEIGEAEAIRRLLESVGVDATVAPAVGSDATSGDDAPQKVLVPAASLEAAQDALAGMGDPDDDLYDR